MGRKKASGSTAAEEVGGEPAMAASKKNKKKGQFAVDDDEYMVVDQLDEDSSMRSNGQHHVSADNETDLASSFEQMDLSQKKKKTRGKNTEPDPDDTESELSVAADNGAASKKKGKKGKKGFPVDDDEYDVSALDDAKSVQSTESSQSHDHMKKGGHDLDEKDNDSWSQDAVQGMKKGKKGKPSKKERDADDYTEEDLGLTSIKKGKKAMGAAKPKSNASFALLEEMDGFGNVPEDGSEVNDSVPTQLEDGEDEVGISEHVLVAGKTKSKAGIENVKASGIEDVETNSIKEDEDLDTIIFSGTKKAKGKKGAKSDHMGFAALDTLTDTAKSAEEDNENEESLAFSGKKKSKKSKDIKKTMSEETVDELPYKEGKDGQSETMKVETVVDEVSEADALFFSGKKKSKGKKGMKTMEEASEAGLAVLDDHADGFKGVLDQEYDLGDEDAIIFSGKKKSKKNKEIKRAEDDEFGLETATKADNVDDALDSEDAIVFSGKKKGKSKQGSKVALDVDLDDTSLSRERGLSVTEQLDDSSLQISDELRSSALAEEDTVQFTGKKKGKKGKISDKPSEDADIDAILADLERTKADKDSKALPGEVDVVDPIKFEDVGAASKKKSKKGKKSGRTVQEEEDLDAILAELEGPKPVQQPESSNSVQPAQEASSQPDQDPSQPAYVTASMPPEVLDEADGVDAVESAAAKKKKKKKEKEKAKAAGKQLDQADAEIVEDQQEAPKSKVLDKKVPKHVREMQERLARQKEAEERIRREEEERRRKEEEEQRRLEELEREREEAKRRRKEREKEKLLKKKQEGKLLTGKQKEEARRLALMREQLLAQKGSSDLDAPTKEDSIPKKPKYDNKKKRRPQGGESVSSTEQPVEDLEVPLPQESHMEIDFVVEKETETESEVVVVEEEVVAEAEAEEEDEDWDAKSWDIELPPVKSAFAEEEDTVSAPKVAKSVITQPSQDAPPAKRPVSPQKSSVQKPRSTAPQPSSNDLESEDETDSEDETESEEEDADTRRRREASLKREARKAEALAKRSAEDLRSPICCILGHVDTGKTKLLDCIRRTNVQEGEAGGITQQIGATYFPMENILERTKELKSDVAVRVPGLLVIDTPGHESFTNLRSRGSGLCDIAILVVDIMHGLEPQTLESLNLLKMRHTPFVVALNKVDRLYNWKTLPNAPIRIAFKQQSKDVINEFERRLSQIVTELKEQGMNSELYYKNKEIRKVVSIVPTSAISGEGVPDLLMLLVHLTQKVMEDKLMYISEVQCTVLEVKVIEGLGTTIDVILVNGVLHESDQIVVCGMQGPIVTNIRALLTPHPMKELRVKGSYQHHKELKAAQGIKITAQGLEHAIAGTQLHVVGPDDDLEDVKVEAMQDMKNVMSRVDKSGEGVCVQASTLGSLEALLEFLKSPAVKIPVSGINIGPVHKRDVMRASVMLERKKRSNMEEQEEKNAEITRAGDHEKRSSSPLPSPSATAAASEPPPSTSRASAASSSFSSTRSNASPKKPYPSPGRGDGSSPQKLRRSTRMILINPPSAFHPDIHPPSLVRVQRALYAHGRGLPLGSHHLQHALPASAFRDEQGRFILEGSSGGYYVGDVLGGLPHGHGQHHIPLPTSGTVHLLYDGEWTHGSKTGSGSVFYTNGEEYQGELRHNQRWGHGWMRYKDGSFYAGDWLRGRRHGIGIHYFTNGNCYCGAFCKDSQDGWGTFYWPSMRRKFEGEWVTNQPYSGYYSQIDTKDFEFIGKKLLQDSPQSIFCLLLDKIPTEEREIAELNLQNPIWTIFNVISVLRSLRAGDHDSKILFKTQVGRKENLTSAQLQTLKKLFEVMAPVTDNKAQLHVTHLRRMLVLARINPDIGQGEKLLAHLRTCTTGKTSVGFDELLLYILQYHHP